MKKLLTLSILFLASAGLCFAELYPDSRLFEVGLDLQLHADENVKPLSEIFIKDIEIDLTKIADSMGDNGMIVNAGGDTKFFINTNFGKKFGMGLFFDIDASARMGVSKEFFDLLAEGNELDTPIVSTVSAGLEMYAEVGTPVKLKIGKLGLKVTPSYFLPILYMPQPDATITVTTNSDGTMTADGSAAFKIYSLVNMGSVFDSKFNFLGFDSLLSGLADGEQIMALAQSGGFDVSAEAEYPVLRTLDLGVYTRMPVMPGTLNYVTSGTATYSAVVNPILNSLTGDGNSETYTTDGPNYDGVTFGKEEYKINRPFRLGIEGAWRPFGSWCTFRPAIGVAARNPFGEDFDWNTSVFTEYNLSVDMRFLYVLGIKFATLYKNEVFAQTAGLTLNLRLFELDVNVASTSADFVKSWELSGLDAFIGLRLGF